MCSRIFFKKLHYLVVSNKAGLTAFSAKVFVDCTGDAGIISQCGLAFEYEYRTRPEMHHTRKDCQVYDIVRSDKYPLVTDEHSCNSLIGPRTVGFNAGHLWNVHATDPLNVSRALIEGRRLAHQFHQGLKEFYPEAFAASFLSATAPAMGIRESRRIVGEYELTLQDYMERRTFEDEKEHVNRGELNTDTRYENYGPGESYGIPYRSLIPKGTKNLLVAGQTICRERIVQGSVRVMPTCLVTRQGAGTVAAMAALHDVDTGNLDVNKLRDKLLADGAYLK